MSDSSDCYELRLYTCKPGRLPDLHHRMGYEVPPLFAKHGVSRPLQYWDGYAGEFSPLYAYLLRWPSLGDRFRAFSGFYADPEWHAQRAASDAGEHMLDRVDLLLMQPLQDWDAAACGPWPPGCIHELRLVQLSNHAPQEAQDALVGTDLPFLAGRGAAVLGVFQVVFGGRMPQAVVLLSWPSFEAREAALLAYEQDATIAAQRASERQQFGRSLIGAVRTSLMRPASYLNVKARQSE